MDIHFPPEIEAQLSNLAAESGREESQIVVEMIATQLSYGVWFHREAEKGLASLDRGEFIEHDEVAKRMERILGA